MLSYIAIRTECFLIGYQVISCCPKGINFNTDNVGSKPGEHKTDEKEKDALRLQSGCYSKFFL